MIKFILFIFSFSIISFADENQMLKQQNVLLIQKLIESEEKIAKNFERYILEKYKIPTMSNLLEDEYLGSSFSLSNKFGFDLSFKSSSNLQLYYAITNENDPNDYKNLLYKRDLYREYTSVYLEEISADEINYNNSFTEILLKSDEAKTLHSILKAGYTIEESCPSTSGTLVDKYCSLNDSAIRWYNSSSFWIEYSKKDFDRGNVTISTSSLLSDSRITSLPIGTYIYINNGAQYVKLKDSILKVD